MYSDVARIVLADGTELSQWSEYSIDSDFLTPTDGWSFTWSDLRIWDQVRANLVPDRKVQIWIGDSIQCTGWIDSVRASSSADAGLSVQISGRDVLRPLIKANVHPDVRIKDRTLSDLLEAICKYVYKDVPTIWYDNNENIKILTSGTTAKGKSRKSSAQNKVEYCQAHPNEGAFEFITRNLKRFGLWIWATAEGDLVVAGPTYQGDPAAIITRKRGQQAIVAMSAEYAWDRTNSVGNIFVRGKSAKKEFAKTTVFGEVADPAFAATDFKEIMYLSHDQAETSKQAQAYAQQEMSRLKQGERTYSCSCLGHRNPATGKLYAVDTLVQVEDEILGVNELLWCAGRTFKRSVTGGTTTDLRLLPVGAVKFSDADAP